MIKNKIRSFDLLACIALASIIFSLVISTCVAASSDLKSTFDESEYKVQLQNMATEIHKINDDVKNGKISQDQANNTLIHLLDDPQYNQIKIKKQIVEQKRNAYLNRKPSLIPGTPEFNKLKLTPDKIETSNTLQSQATSSYIYTSLNDIQYESDGWGEGTSRSLSHTSPYYWVQCAALSGLIGDYYAMADFDKFISAPKSGYAIVQSNIYWTGACTNPVDCSVKLNLYKYVSGQGYQLINSGTAVSLSGLRSTSGPNSATASFQAYMQAGAEYYLDTHVETEAATYVSGVNLADFGFNAIGGTPSVRFVSHKLIY